MVDNLTPKQDFDEENKSEGIPEPSPDFNDQEPIQAQGDEVSEHDMKITMITETSEAPQNNLESKEKTSAGTLSAQDARTWAALAHLSVLLNLFTGFLGTIAALLIYLVFKNRSRLVAYHAMQSFVFQAITWFGAGLLAVFFIGFGTSLFFLVIPLLCLIPGFLFLLAIPASLIYGIVGAVQVGNGEDFRYWMVGDWVREILEPKTQA